MWIETRHVLSPEFLQFFKSYRDDNINNWNSATCSLAILHWAALGGGFLHLLSDGGCTVNLGDISNQIKAQEDGTQVGSLQYIHKWTGLKKILEFYSTISDEKIQLSFFWKDNKSQEASMIFNKGISLDVFVLDLYGETVMDVYFVHHIWKLITMANVGLIYDLEEKKEYLQSLLNSTHDDQYKQEFYKQLLILGLSVLQGHSGLEYLEKAWALNATDYHLHFVVTHIHKILVNYDSELQLYKPEENPKAARSKLENGKHTFEAFYICKRSGAERKLIITETVTANTRRKLYIRFGHQVIEVKEEQLKNLSKLSFHNLWLFSANVRVNLICERRMDKLNELMSAFFNADTPGKRHFVQLLLNDFTCNLEVHKHQLHWWNQLLWVTN
ncbi:unnamed protein product [Orchesella dallaii]|uniref:Uncharacterized protein n=1 Tax=Orchesella dallaii TaxID=48710 RepID=A0ABP1RMU4_9HEXA